MSMLWFAAGCWMSFGLPIIAVRIDRWHRAQRGTVPKLASAKATKPRKERSMNGLQNWIKEAATADGEVI